MGRELDKNIERVLGWIKHYYSNYQIQPNEAMDRQGYELAKQLNYYYHYRRQKDDLLANYRQLHDEGGAI